MIVEYFGQHILMRIVFIASLQEPDHLIISHGRYTAVLDLSNIAFPQQHKGAQIQPKRLYIANSIVKITNTVYK